jgi:primosomal protein N' (replication factor Y)
MGRAAAGHELEMDDLFTTARGETGAALSAGEVLVRVAVERGIDQLDASGLTYLAPEGIAVGERVDVPLGRGNKAAPGIVTEVGGEELAAGLARERIKPILKRSGASLSPVLVELARWMAGYYVCPLGMVLATMMPAAVKKRIGLRTRVEVERVGAHAGADATLAEVKMPPTVRAAWSVIEAMDAAAFPLPPAQLARAAGAATLGPINRLVKLGLLRQVERPIIAAAAPPWEGLSLESVRSAGGERPTLTPQQSAVIEGIRPALGAGFSVHLLRGITGSGKTEIYLRLIEQVLADGRTALVMVPEIALTPQTTARFTARFAREGVAVLHSGLSNSQRHRQWALAASGAARVVVGARSSVFSPLENLGVIVVDEEHDQSYKQDQLPRYHARDLAIKRAHLENVPVILGSATPSLESWYNATRPTKEAASAKYHLWELTERVGGGCLPRVEIVNIADEARARAASGALKIGGPWAHQIGPTLEHAIADTLGSGGQVILLLNRRGYANYICCPSARCGWLMQCRDCDVMMVFHKGLRGQAGYVRCHHCLAEQLLPRECPLCKSKVNVFGSGTQRVEEELERKFGSLLSTSPPGEEPQVRSPAGATPGSAMLRVDSDTMRSGRDYCSALSRFASGEIRLLIGTQMIAKGLDFPGVHLVGIVNADTSLALPDFRAAERTFQLVSQVAGRTGRGVAPGRVIVQTASPNEPAIRLAAAHDYPAFAEQELRFRARAGLPPMTKMARIVVRDELAPKAQERASELAAALRDAPGAAATDTQIIGPAPCAIERIAGQHRFEITLVSPRRAAIQSLLGGLRARGLLTSDSHTAVDVDPVALM